VTEPVDTEKGVPDGFFLTSNVHKIHFPGPLWVGLWRLYMPIKVPVWCNLVLLIYPSYGPWKSLNLILTNGQEPCKSGFMLVNEIWSPVAYCFVSPVTCRFELWYQHLGAADFHYLSLLWISDIMYIYLLSHRIYFWHFPRHTLWAIKTCDIFTAQCTLVQSAVLRSHVVCPSVTLVICDHIGWKSWKLIAQAISPPPSLIAAKRRSTYSHGNMGKFWGD